MKTSSAILAASTALNVAVIGLFFARPSLAPAAFRDTFHLQSTTSAAEVSAAPRRIAAVASRAKPAIAFATNDLPTLIAQLREAGFPPSVIREIVRAQVSARYDSRIRAMLEPDPNIPYWRQPPGGSLRSGTAQFEEYQNLQRERSKILRELFKDPFFATDDVAPAQRRQFGNLSRQQIDLVQRIEEDYGEMTSAIRAGARGIVLAEDRAKLALLDREKEADLAAVLSPSELTDYQLRTSPITRMLARELGDFHPTEAEFRAIYDQQKALNDKVPYAGLGGVDFQARREAQTALNDELRARLGDARYNDYVRETSSEYPQLRTLVQRDNLPADVAKRVFDLRDTVAPESMRIVNDPQLSLEQKRAALATLAQTTRNQALTLLGPTSGPAYVQTMDRSWLSMVERGSGVTFDGGPNRMMGSDNVAVSLGTGPTYHPIRPANPAPSR